MKLKQILEIKVDNPRKYFTINSEGECVFKNGLTSLEITDGGYIFLEILDGVWDEDFDEMKGMNFEKKIEYMLNNEPSDELVDILSKLKELKDILVRLGITHRSFMWGEENQYYLEIEVFTESLKDYIK